MICKLEIHNGELNLFPVVTNERVFAQITMGNIVKGQPGKSPIIGENDNWWVYNNETGEYEDTGKIATTSDDVVKYVEAKDEQHPNRKAIQLANGDLITGVAKKEGLGSVNIAMVNEWDVVDLGTSELPINLNTPKGVRPTVQEAGQRGTSGGTVISGISTLTQAGYTLEEVLRNTILTYPKTANSSGQVYTLNCSQVIKISNTEYQLYFPVHKVSQVDGKNQVVVSYVNVATILKPSEQVGWVIGNVQVFSNEDPFVN